MRVFAPTTRITSRIDYESRWANWLAQRRASAMNTKILARSTTSREQNFAAGLCSAIPSKIISTCCRSSARGKKSRRTKWKFFLTADEEEFAEEFLAKTNCPAKKPGVHVGSGGTKNLRLKRWPLKNYAGLVRKLNKERPDIRILLFGGPEEAKGSRSGFGAERPWFDAGGED